MLFAFGFQNGGTTEALGFQNGGALVAFSLHLTAHGFHQIAGRVDVLDFDAGHFHAPRLGGLIHHTQKPVIDFVALGQQAVQLHGTHDGADIGHGHVDNGVMGVLYFVSRLGSVHDLIEGDAVHGDHGVIASNHFLRWHLHDLLHHVLFMANAINEGNDESQTGLQGAHIFAEAFNGIVITLRHHANSA